MGLVFSKKEAPDRSQVFYHMKDTEKGLGVNQEEGPNMTMLAS